MKTFIAWADGMQNAPRFEITDQELDACRLKPGDLIQVCIPVKQGEYELYVKVSKVEYLLWQKIKPPELTQWVEVIPYDEIPEEVTKEFEEELL